MSKHGVTPLTCPDFKNYTSEQIRKFKEIMDAISAKDMDLANRLTDALGTDEAKFEEYMEDCEKFDAYNKSVQAQLEYHQKEIDSAQQRVDVLQTERKEIIRQHKPEVVASLPKSNGHTNTSTNGKKKSNTCTLI